MDFQRRLLDIGNSLSREEVRALAFLCTDLLGRNVKCVESASQLFTCMTEQDQLSDGQRHLLTELLVTIRRTRLASELNPNDPDSGPRGLVSAYRKMLYELSEEITEEDLTQMKFLLYKTLPRRKLDDSVTTLELFLELEHTDHLSESNVVELETIIQTVCPVLVEKIQQFRAQREPQTSPIAQETGDRMSTSLTTSQDSLPSRDASNLSHPLRDEHPVPSSITASLIRSDAVGFPCEENGGAARTQPPHTEGLQAYPMPAEQRGVCLIVNNYRFRSPLKVREGTAKDEERLVLVFRWLGFQVEVHRDCTGAQVQSVLRELGSRDHSRVHSVVCCIMSHGKEESVLGVDGAAVRLPELRQHLNGLRCPSLANKPKLFFIQACQGTNEQQPVYIQSDGGTDGSICSDAVALRRRRSIPSDADFLFAMSTVPSCLSYRDRSSGSWFIQSLCQNLVQMVPRGCDLVSILTKVNSDVSQKTTAFRKQMPQPQFTLTKKVMFPNPEAAPPLLPPV